MPVPGRFWAETFPFLKYTPNILAPWKKEIEDRSHKDFQFHNNLMEAALTDAAKSKLGNAKSSFANPICVMNREENWGLSRRELVQMPSSLFTAAFDSTASTLCSCLLALITHPQVAKTAQAELDSLLPATLRSPTFADQEKLPYIRALIQETARWRPAIPLGVPHASTAAYVYKGYQIPAGTTVIAPTWTLNHDAEFFPSPATFEPGRFLPRSHARRGAGLCGSGFPNPSGNATFG